MNIRALLVIVLILITSAAFAQSRKGKKKPVANTQQPNALNPEPKKNYAPKPSRKSADGPTFESEQKYYDRMAALEKAKRKTERLQSLPQYSDPMYFGHKRPPKKRKPGKMKYCRECGIRH